MNNLRNKIKSLRQSLSENEVNDLSNKILNNLFSLDVFSNNQNFFVYKSFKNEVSTKKLIDFLIAKNKTVAFPVTDALIMSAGIPQTTAQIKSQFGVYEPKEFLVMEKVDVCFVPLVLADTNKNRVGFGKGYYDRFLSNNPCLKIGLAYDFQIVDCITPNPWDIPLDIIVTESRIIR